MTKQREELRLNLKFFRKASTLDRSPLLVCFYRKQLQNHDDSGIIAHRFCTVLMAVWAIINKASVNERSRHEGVECCAFGKLPTLHKRVISTLACLRNTAMPYSVTVFVSVPTGCNV
ncbi:hypothetical protein Tcan_00166 [Toxocara canis]|uniref:Uncharacterized protein n=1 Tax=Toxocara canis TaxID=6265 RepID=A0A0B2VG65_TOXCA|nr:hypothetical protein Tcan_00166 [Toxocara canis]